MGGQIFQKTHGQIMHPFSSNKDALTVGFAAFDEISLDKDEMTYVDDFMFLFPTSISYPSTQSSESPLDYFGLDGVIGLNQYGFDTDPRAGMVRGMQGQTNLIKGLIEAGTLINQTLGLELNPTDKKDDIRSYFSYNGIDRTAIGDNPIHFYKNQLKLGKWVVNLQKAFLSKMSDAADFYKKYRATRKCPAVIASAQDTIKLPKEDFDSLLSLIKSRDKDAELTENGSILSKKNCT